ncbi:MAG: hypothetical protein BWY25_00410 [Chloroflexi bacterium ADurb.Bin222]|nr:MAG: hypothetical protein BWY25_00410 [Chloroflexi bacterium ADurb.Bin222]
MDPIGVRPHAEQAQVARHREEEQWHRKDQADDEHPLLTGDFISAGFGFGVLGLAAEFQRLEAGLRHGFAELRLADEGGHVAHAGLFCRQRDLRFQHALELEQSFFEPPGVVSIGKPLDAELGLTGSDAVAGALDACGEGGEVHQRRVEDHCRALRREVHHGILHARLPLQAAFDCRHAVCARHTGDGKG